MNFEKHIWEGWTVGDFIADLHPILDMIMSGNSFYSVIKTKKELKLWCIDNQPYYKKYIPEVVQYFSNAYKLN